MDCGTAWNCRQGVAAVVAGIESVAANALVARAASDRNVLAQLNRAAVGAGLKAGLTGLAVVAGGDASAALRGAVRLGRGLFPSRRRGEKSEASRGYEKNAHVPVSAPKEWPIPDDSRALGFCRGPRGEAPHATFPRSGTEFGGKGLKVKRPRHFPSTFIHCIFDGRPTPLGCP